MLRKEMEKLHQTQMRLAQHAAASLLKEKASNSARWEAMSGRQSVLPALSPHSPRRSELESQSRQEVPPASTVTNSRSAAIASPHPTVVSQLAQSPRNHPSSPVKQAAPKIFSAELMKSLANRGDLPPFYNRESASPRHSREHYYPDSDLYGLSGSFVDDSFVSEIYDPAEPAGESMPMMNVASTTVATALHGSVKEDEVKDPEPTRASPTPTLSHLNKEGRDNRDSLPTEKVTDHTNGGTSRVSKPGHPCNTVSVSGRYEARSMSSKPDYPGPTSDQSGRSDPISTNISRRCLKGEQYYDFEIDVRERVEAQLRDVSAPLRMLRLTPQKPSEAPRNEPKDSPRSRWPDSRLEDLVEVPNSTAQPRVELNAVMKGCRIARPRPRALAQRPQAELVQKQGFLVAFRVDHASATKPLTRSSGTRQYYVLVGHELREYADTIALHKLELERCGCFYQLNEATGSSVRDVDRATLPWATDGERSQTFALAVNPTTTFAFMAPSLTEKRQWTFALGEACTLEARHCPNSPYPSARQIELLSPRSRAKAAQDALSAANAMNDELQVRYRIT